MKIMQLKCVKILSNGGLIFSYKKRVSNDSQFIFYEKDNLNFRPLRKKSLTDKKFESNNSFKKKVI